MKNEKAGAATNIAQAIETAWGIFPADANKRIVLISDGVETRGDVLRAGLRGKAFGVQIDTVPIYPSDAPEVMIERIDAPMQVKQGEAVSSGGVCPQQSRGFRRGAPA